MVETPRRRLLAIAWVLGAATLLGGASSLAQAGIGTAAPPSAAPGAGARPSSGLAAAREERRVRRGLRAPAGPALLTVQAWRGGSPVKAPISLESAALELTRPQTILWADLQNPSQEQLDGASRAFGIWPQDLDEAAASHDRPSVRAFPTYNLMVVEVPTRMLRDQVVMSQLSLVIGRNFLVTVHSAALPMLDDARRMWDALDPVERRKMGALVHAVLETCVSAYAAPLDAIEDELSQIELEIFKGNDDRTPRSLMSVKRRLLGLRRGLYPMSEVLDSFVHPSRVLFPGQVQYFQDLYDLTVRIRDDLDSQSTIASDAMNAHLAQVQNSLNQAMSLLTVLGVCVAIMGAVFGAWGMNFKVIPIAEHRWGFWLVFLAIVVVCGILLTWTKLLQVW